MQNVAPVSQDKIQNLVDYIKLEDVKASSDCQPREAINTDTVSEYAEQMAEGTDFPPITVFYDGETNWLADGFHRYHAANEADLVEIKATIHNGSKRDAILHSCGANARHGLRRTNEDKRRAVLALLHDDEWSLWSDREIARRCDVSTPLASTVRKSLTVNIYSEKHPTERTYRTKHGTVAKMDTTKVGRSNVVEVDFGDGEDDEYELDQGAAYELEALDNPDKGILRRALDVIRGFCGLRIDAQLKGRSKEELQELKTSIDKIVAHCELLKREIAKCQ